MTHPVLLAPERGLLEGLLDAQRDEVAALLDDLTLDEARRRLVPSLTTVLALVKHAAFVERVWFHHRVDGATRAEVGIGETVDESFATGPEDTVESVRVDFLAACARSREIAAAHDLDEQFPWRVGPVSLRFIHGHMIAELARHAGHGDILREQLLAQRTPS